MDRAAEIAVSVPQRSERESAIEEYTTKVLCSLIAMLGGFLQLKQGAKNESLFDTDYPTMASLTVSLIAYGGSLIGSRILHVQARLNSDLAESTMYESGDPLSMRYYISLLFGSLPLFLELVILVPGAGQVALFFWVGCFVMVVAKYACKYLKTLYESAVSSVIHIFGKLKDCLSMIIRRFATKPEEQTNELPQGAPNMV